MRDGPALAAILIFTAWIALRLIFVLIDRRLQRTAGAELTGRSIVHWQYAPDEWRAYCERLRRDLWSRYLRPFARVLIPALVLPVILSPLLEAPAGLSSGELSALLALGALVIGIVLLGPLLRQYLRLTRRRALEYELFVGDRGVLEVWRDHGRVKAREEHLYAGAAIERVEANGVNPTEIVFMVDRPISYGVLHLEEHFLVPQGHIAEAREIARRLSPERRPPASATPA